MATLAAVVSLLFYVCIYLYILLHSLPCWQIIYWIYWITIFSYFKMQHWPLCAAVSQFRNCLTRLNILPFFNQYFTIMSVSAEILVAVINNDKITITQ